MNIGVLNSGGDSPGLNAVIEGVVGAASRRGWNVVGFYDGFEGLLSEEGNERFEWLTPVCCRGLRAKGGTILGTVNKGNFAIKVGVDQKGAIEPAVLEKTKATIRRLGLDALIVVGGDGSQSTALLLSEIGLPVVGVPKTIDNDLYGTDHCPGFGSAAKFIATSCMEVHQDLRVYDKGRVTIVEIMGRHAGWLAGSAALATYAGAGPDLVYLPEVPFRMEEFWQDVDRIYKRNGSCMVAVSEGVQYADGRFVAESGDRDVFGHTQLGGLGAMLAESVKRQTGAKVRSIELSLLQRCASHVASKTDIDEAYMAGKAAVEAAVSGQTDKMVAFERSTENGIYSCKTKLTSLGDVANVEKLVPREWINTRGNGVEQPFIDYVLPLIQGETAMQKECSLPRFAKLKKVLADPVQG